MKKNIYVLVLIFLGFSSINAHGYVSSITEIQSMNASRSLSASSYGNDGYLYTFGGGNPAGILSNLTKYSHGK